MRAVYFWHIAEEKDSHKDPRPSRNSIVEAGHSGKVGPHFLVWCEENRTWLKECTLAWDSLNTPVQWQRYSLWHKKSPELQMGWCFQRASTRDVKSTTHGICLWAILESCRTLQHCYLAGTWAAKLKSPVLGTLHKRRTCTILDSQRKVP